MIVLTQPRIIFLKPQKVAGTSFEIALSKFADETSIITPITEEDEITRKSLGFRGPQNFKMNNLEFVQSICSLTRKDIINFQRPKKFWNHISAKLAKKRLGASTWTQSTKISIVRNPFDMAVSRYFWSRKPIKWSAEDFENFCITNKQLLQQNLNQYQIDGEDVIDLYIKYEDIHNDLNKLEKKFPQLKGLANLFSQIKAKGQYRPREASTSEVFANAPKAKQIIAQTCSFEISKFGYVCP